MGKISDVLDKIDTSKDFGSITSQSDSRHVVESASLTSSSDHTVNKGIKEVVPDETRAETPSVPAPSKVSTDIAIDGVAESIKASGKWDKRLSQAVNDDSAIPEIFKTLRSKILHPFDGRKIPSSIMVSSAISKEGKSFVTANLGISIANGMDLHCLMVDCDLRHPTLARSLGIETKYGLVDYLKDQVDLAELIVKTSVQKLSILPSGNVPNNPAELLSSSRMERFIEEVSSRYEDRIIIFDSPPMLMSAESIVLAGQVDAIIMVIRQGRSKKGEVERFINSVDKEKVLGLVFNGHTSNYMDKSLVEGYGYGYGY